MTDDLKRYSLALRDGHPALISDPNGLWCSYQQTIRASDRAVKEPDTMSEPENSTGPAATTFVDTPLKQAIRTAFDHPSVANIEHVAKVAAEGLIASPAEQFNQGWNARGVADIAAVESRLSVSPSPSHWLHEAIGALDRCPDAGVGKEPQP